MAYLYQLQQIHARVKAATEPSVVLDAWVHLVFRPHQSDPVFRLIESIEHTGDGELRFHWKDGSTGGIWGTHVSAPVTSSVDACLRLISEILPRTCWYMAAGKTSPDEPLYAASIGRMSAAGVSDDDPMSITEHDGSPALALLLAAIEAMLVTYDDDPVADEAVA